MKNNQKINDNNNSHKNMKRQDASEHEKHYRNSDLKIFFFTLKLTLI